MTTRQIGKSVDKIVGNWLKSRGYRYVKVDTKPPDTAEIVADGVANCIIQVKAAVYPNIPQMPENDEISSIMSRAKGAARQAWTALIQVDSSGELVGKIRWRALAN
jgi:hypothetical protein